MTRVEPHLAWTAPFGAATAAAPALVLSKERTWAWRSALAASVLLHVALAVLVGDAVLDAANHAPPPSIEVDLVVPDAPEASVARPPPASEPVQKQETPQQAAPAEPEEPKPAPKQAEVPAEAPPLPEAPGARPALPKETVSPQTKPKPEKADEHVQHAPDHTKPAPPARAEPPPRQEAARPPAPPAGHNLERTDLSLEATVRPIVMPKPVYPPIALQLQEEGIVYLVVDIGADGVPARVKLFQSSGFGSLDQAAVEMMKRWRFAPSVKNGRAVATEVNIPVEFKIKR